MTASSGVAQQIAAITPPAMPVVMRERSCLVGSALGRGRVSRVGSGARERLHVGLGIVKGDDGRLFLVGDYGFGHPRHGLETGLHGVRAGGAIHVLYREGDGPFTGKGSGRGEECECEGSTRSEFAHSVFSIHQSRSRRATKSKPTAPPPTSIAHPRPDFTTLP